MSPVAIFLLGMAAGVALTIAVLVGLLYLVGQAIDKFDEHRIQE